MKRRQLAWRAAGSINASSRMYQVFTCLLILYFMRFYILVWNYQDATNPKFHRVMKEYLRGFDPNLVILVETRVNGFQANSVVRSIEMLNSHIVEAKGFSDGIWIMWKSCVEVRVEVNNTKFVHLKVKFSDFTDWIFLTGVYDILRGVKRRELWSNLGMVAQRI